MTTLLALGFLVTMQLQRCFHDKLDSNLLVNSWSVHMLGCFAMCLSGRPCVFF